MPTCFISYAHTPHDTAAVARVRWLLDRSSISYWFDHQLMARDGLGLNAEIAREIDRSEVVIAVASSQSLASPYCQAEIARASSGDKKLVRLDIEPVRLPGAMITLGSATTVTWYDSPEHQIDARLLAALAEKGIVARLSPADFAAFGWNPIDDPMAALVRPSFAELKAGSADRLEAYSQRMTKAISICPDNGYNHLSMALIRIAQSDARMALACANRAVELLPKAAAAHHAEALARCLLIPSSVRNRGDVEMILRRLAVARRQRGAGAHTDLLSAIVIANYYLPRHLKPPAAPNDLLVRGASSGIVFDVDENRRVFATEAIKTTPDALQPALLGRYLGLP